MNLKPLKPSRKRLRIGDVFAMLPPDGPYLFGRVIDTEAKIVSMTGVIMIYIFEHRSPVLEMPDRAKLRVENLLLPPILINRLPWSRGYLETIGNMPLGPGERLTQHCFLNYAYTRDRHFDELGNELRRPVEPIGELLLNSFRTLDNYISDALGIPRAPDD